MGLFDFWKRKKVPAIIQVEPDHKKAQVDARMAEYERLKKSVLDNPPGRELDLLIAQQVTDLPGAGYWRRSSWTTTNWEPCKKGDRSPGDATTGPMSSASDVYYDIGGGAVYAIPYYSTDANAMLSLIAHLSETRHARFSLNIDDESEVTVSAGDCNCPHSKEYDPGDGHGWTYIDEVYGKTPMHAVAVAALEFCKKVKALKQTESAA
jgi:hypothetical protein